MKQGHLIMSNEERQRLIVFNDVKQRKMKLKNASEKLKISYRQTQRVYKRFISEGENGLVHKGRGKISNRRINQDLRNKIISLYKEKYWDFGPKLASEKLLLEGIHVHPETLRRWLIQEGLWIKKRERRKHKKRRERKEHFGELVQMDGSHHWWFEDRGEKCCLMNMVDDATGTTLSLFDKEETTYISLVVLWEWIKKYGIPKALYTDRKNVFVTNREPTLEEQLNGEEPLTSFGKVCNKLGIEIITAYSPQAKGRVERNHAVYQDRLVKNLRLNKINTIEKANDYLNSGFIDELNSKFAIEAKENVDYHAPLLDVDLRKIFCFEEKRTLTNDYTIRYNNMILQILCKKGSYLPPRAKIIVAKWLDSSIHLIYNKKELSYRYI